MTAPEKISLVGDDAVKLWLKGKDAWNEWVDNNPIADISFDDVNFAETREYYEGPEGEWPFASFNFPTGRISFVRALFGSGGISFSNTNFGTGPVNFTKANFGGGRVSFDSADFGDGTVTFANAVFGNGEVDFMNSRFGTGSVTFFSTKFGDGDCQFRNVSFGDGNVRFEDSVFGEGTFDLEEATFGVGELDFTNAEFECRVSMVNLAKTGMLTEVLFTHANFANSLNISSVDEFGCVIDLTGTQFANQVLIENVKCNSDTEPVPGWKGRFLTCRQAKNRNDISRFRRLKEIAKNNEDYVAAHEYQVQELRSRRWHETGFSARFLEFIYSALSNYGRSEFLPLAWIFIVYIGFGLFYAGIANKAMLSQFERVKTGLDFSMGQMLAFAPASRASNARSIKTLFELDQIPSYLQVISTAQNLIAIILIFLFGLCLRNRFRI